MDPIQLDYDDKAQATPGGHRHCVRRTAARDAASVHYRRTNVEFVNGARGASAVHGTGRDDDQHDRAVALLPAADAIAPIAERPIEPGRHARDASGDRHGLRQQRDCGGTVADDGEQACCDGAHRGRRAM